MEVFDIGGGGGVRTSWTTDGDGRFLASGVAAGRYAVCFHPTDSDLAQECWEDVEPSRPDWTPIEVSEGQVVTGIDAALEPASHLGGTVTDERGAPAAGVRVFASWYEHDPDNSVACCVTAVTAEDGSFEVGPIYSGDYTLMFSDRERARYATEWWDGATDGRDATHVLVERGESVDHLDAELEDLAHVSGRVQGAGGSRARDAVVRVFEVSGSDGFTEVRSGPVGADGTYDVTGLQPGRYRVAFDAAPGRFRSEYWDDVRKIGVARDVVISGTTSVSGVDAVLSLAPPVRATQAPSITGRARVGNRLRVTGATWDVPSLRFAYQWRADGVVIPGATERRLRLTPRLRGKHISARVKATATADERSPGSATTGRTQPVAPARS